MTGKRDYPLAVVVHQPNRPHVQARPLSQLSTLRSPSCTKPQAAPPFHFPQHAVGVVEPVEFPAHLYEESTVTYPDATCPMCRACGGIHGVLDVLQLSPGAGTAGPARPALPAHPDGGHR